jgi:hypothetical protein
MNFFEVREQWPDMLVQTDKKIFKQQTRSILAMHGYGDLTHKQAKRLVRGVGLLAQPTTKDVSFPIFHEIIRNKEQGPPEYDAIGITQEAVDSWLIRTDDGLPEYFDTQRLRLAAKNVLALTAVADLIIGHQQAN